MGVPVGTVSSVFGIAAGLLLALLVTLAIQRPPAVVGPAPEPA